MNGNRNDSQAGSFEWLIARGIVTRRTLAMHMLGPEMLRLRRLGPALLRRSTILQLTPPKTVTFLISVLAAIAASIHYAHVPIPYTHSGFSILFAGYAVLLAGNLLEGV